MQLLDLLIKLKNRNILECAQQLSSFNDINISNICLDSRKVKAGDIFIAYKGTTCDGRDFIESAITNKAHVIIYDADNYELSNSLVSNYKDVVFLPVKSLPKYISDIAGIFYDEPSRHQNIYAVTGTNGKTTCAFLAAQLLANINHSISGFIGTIGYTEINHKQNSHCILNKLTTTTPDPVQLQQILSEYRAKDIKDICLEASSHALVQDRVNGININTAIFTNLSQDHLDYHNNMDDYFNAKSELFFFSSVKNIIINIDDKYGVRLFNKLLQYAKDTADNISNKTILLYTCDNVKYQEFKHRLIDGCGIMYYYSRDSSITIYDYRKNYESGLYQIKMPPDLIGRFNIYNILAVISALLANGYNIDDILKHIVNLKPPPGRMEIFHADNNVKLIVDFAHTPDALCKSLQAIRQHYANTINKVWCIFGCGGDRDAAKRPAMGKIAAEYADQLILTDDNVRTEDPKQIIADILSGIDNSFETKVFATINNRQQAIKQALTSASPNDIILIAGKGHEDYQIYGNKVLNYNEREYVSGLVK
jgi:UDP-N-acetylmuramoyl-L-alanyl-D-glutamate--2,6-diaminopimelate ligase